MEVAGGLKIARWRRIGGVGIRARVGEGWFYREETKGTKDHEAK
jgi:hypothetical protein